MKTAIPAVLLLGLVWSAGFTAHASGPRTSQDDASTVDAASVAADNQVAGVDPKTGKLRQLTPDEIRDLSERAAAMPKHSAAQWDRAPRTASEARATLRKHAGGGMSMRVPVSAMSAVTVQQDASGQLHYSENDHGRENVSQATQEVSE